MNYKHLYFYVVEQVTAVTDGMYMYCRLTILTNIDYEYLSLYYRWIAGLIVWITIYAVLTSIGFCKFKKIWFRVYAVKVLREPIFLW